MHCILCLTLLDMLSVSVLGVILSPSCYIAQSNQLCYVCVYVCACSIQQMCLMGVFVCVCACESFIVTPLRYHLTLDTNSGWANQNLTVHLVCRCHLIEQLSATQAAVAKDMASPHQGELVLGKLNCFNGPFFPPVPSTCGLSFTHGVRLQDTKAWLAS